MSDFTSFTRSQGKSTNEGLPSSFVGLINNRSSGPLTHEGPFSIAGQQAVKQATAPAPAGTPSALAGILKQTGSPAPSAQLQPPGLVTPGTAAPGATTPGNDPVSWAKDLLKRLGAPDNPNNEAALKAWEAQEGGWWNNSAQYNPLNTTQNEPGAVPMNSVGVKRYPSYETGMQGTLQTLNYPSYSAIVQLLRSGTATPQQIENAISASPWGTHFGG